MILSIYSRVLLYQLVSVCALIPWGMILSIMTTKSDGKSADNHLKIYPLAILLARGVFLVNFLFVRFGLNATLGNPVKDC